MPRRKGKRAPGRKAGRGGRKRKGGKSRGSTMRSLSRLQSDKVPRSLNGTMPFPVERKFRLALIEHVPITFAAAVFGVYDFKINSANKPDDLTAVQPSGYAAVNAIYDQYKVEGFKMRYIVVNEGAIDVNFGWVFRAATKPSTVLTSVALINNALAVPPSSRICSVSAAGGQNRYTSKWFSVPPSMVLGNNIEYFGNNLYGAAFGADPTNLIYGSFVVYSDTTNLVAGLQLTVEMIFNTRAHGISNNVTSFVPQRINEHLGWADHILNSDPKDLNNPALYSSSRLGIDSSATPPEVLPKTPSTFSESAELVARIKRLEIALSAGINVF